MYSVKEIYYTLQGEGHHTGRAAVFLRFSGCNLWSGLEKDRASAICQFCDTDFWGTDGTYGGKYDATELAEQCLSLWPLNNKRPFIVCTGGEPLLQLDDVLIKALHDKGFFICIESNGTIPVPDKIDWVCISPKAHAELVVNSGQELKVVFPQNGMDPRIYEHLDFDYLSIQPLDDENSSSNVQKSIQFCKENPRWSLSIQMHKIAGIR